mgnify:CR=1 FL=1
MLNNKVNFDFCIMKKICYLKKKSSHWVSVVRDTMHFFFFAEAAENTTPQETENVEEGETPLPPKQNLTQIR